MIFNNLFKIIEGLKKKAIITIFVLYLLSNAMQEIFFFRPMQPPYYPVDCSKKINKKFIFKYKTAN